ncbi:MAG: biopolymer transporter ExbD [Gammaproteobacteria bacterium]|nr:biopolymer transporter ExbD [Gammaproteobacteria bacterium]
MNMRPHPKQSPELNITPLIDVVFLLLIFFMVSTTFDKDAQIRVELPQASTNDEQTEQDKTLDVTVDKNGRYYVNQKEVINTKAGTLRRAIENATGSSRNIPVIITADAQTTHQSVVKVMDVASQMGFLNMTFAARQPLEEE